MEPTPDTPPRAWLAIPAVVLVLVALWEIVATLRAPSGVPDDAAWKRASDRVRAGYKSGDLIVFAPTWNEPVGRMYLGDLITVDDAARMDAAKYARIWELSIRDARSPDTAGLAAAETLDESGIVIRRFERTPVTVLADLRTALPTAKIEKGSARVVLAEVGFEPHRCVQASPGTRITYSLELGSELVGYVGIADVFTRRDVRDPAELDVEIAGTVVATAKAGVDDGWVRFAAPTTAGQGDVSIVIRSRAPGRLVCFAGEARQ